jgi:hypothetical protein
VPSGMNDQVLPQPPDRDIGSESNASNAIAPWPQPRRVAVGWSALLGCPMFWL